VLHRRCSKKTLVLFAAGALLAGTSPALAGHESRDDRDSGLSVRQTELDEEYAHSLPTIVPGTPARPSTPYGYAPPRRAAAEHRHGLNR